jgi:hypothetical protein
VQFLLLRVAQVGDHEGNGVLPGLAQEAQGVLIGALAAAEALDGFFDERLVEGLFGEALLAGSG